MTPAEECWWKAYQAMAWAAYWEAVAQGWFAAARLEAYR